MPDFRDRQSAGPSLGEGSSTAYRASAEWHFTADPESGLLCNRSSTAILLGFENRQVISTLIHHVAFI